MENNISTVVKKPFYFGKKVVTGINTLALSMVVSGQVYAAGGALPSVDVPGGSSTDYVSTAKNILFAVLGVVIAVVVLVAFIVSAKNTINAYNEWRTGRIAFFDLGATLAVTIILLIAIVWLMNTAKTSFGLTF